MKWNKTERQRSTVRAPYPDEISIDEIPSSYLPPPNENLDIENAVCDEYGSSTARIVQTMDNQKVSFDFSKMLCKLLHIQTDHE